jgi:hypothetical protein
MSACERWANLFASGTMRALGRNMTDYERLVLLLMVVQILLEVLAVMNKDDR